MSIPRKTLVSCLMGWLAVVAAGCEAEKPTPPEPTADGAAVRASVTLRVAVVDDEDLRRGIDRLRGEWNARSDGEIESVPVARDADLVAAAAEADLIVFPSRAIGELCEAGALRPVRSSVLKSETLRFEDLLPLVRDQEIVYAQRVMALPLGCPTPVCLLPESGARALTMDRDDDTELALAYLAWLAPHAVHRSRVATLFDSDTFEPRLTEPPFVRALEDFVTENRGGPGQIAWPRRREPLTVNSRPQVMPPADEVFDPIAEQWEAVPDFPEANRFATVVASSGRLIGVTKVSRNSATAFRYAAWLAGPGNARELASSSDYVANCRGSFARAGDAWRESDNRELARQFSGAAAAMLRLPRFLIAPRLPGSERYLATLGAQVRAALEGEAAAAALLQAAVDWEAISQEFGRGKQHQAYLRSVNTARFPRERRD